ncbi:MAG: cob(I)yrinic acid a,c-diamide adenosyltransferase, partial [Peptostreptococcaceae bacterium]|nr:cob(I)yrinic acid a,c-diamide adenosyltransferase [Peptostreptococcaceae bacterium]
MNKGLVHLYFGDGKGKTTAAIGLGIRACGRGKKILLVQFLKGNDSGEILFLESNNAFKILKDKPVKKFIHYMSEDEKAEVFICQKRLFQSA